MDTAWRILKLVCWPFSGADDLGTALLGWARIMWAIVLPCTIALLVLL